MDGNKLPAGYVISSDIGYSPLTAVVLFSDFIQIGDKTYRLKNHKWKLGSSSVVVASIVEEAQRHLRGGGTCTFSMPEYSDSVLVSIVDHLRTYLEVHEEDVREDDSILWSERSRMLERIHTTYVQLGHVLDFILFDIKP